MNNLNQGKLKQALDWFEEYRKQPRYLEDTKEREDRRRFFQKSAREKFDELVFSEMIKKLWASRIWSNKDYLVDQIMKSNNGLEKLQKEFEVLKNNSFSPAERYQRHIENIKGMGPSMVTELICHLDPQEAGIWNVKARKALAWLEVRNIKVDKYKIGGNEYKEFNSVLKELAKELKQRGFTGVDLLLVDYFLWEIWDHFAKSEPEPARHVKKIETRHDELVDMVAQIGTWLGFKPEAPKKIAKGAILDVIWSAKIANLGSVIYAIEVQDKGSIDSLVLNLQKAQANASVQKLIVVSDTEQLDRIKGEIEAMPDHFKKAVSFWDSKEVEAAYQALEQVTQSIERLRLNPEWPFNQNAA